MPIKSKKPCRKFGCKNLAISPNYYCDFHKDLEVKDKQERNEFYDKHREERYKLFYHSKEWNRVRQQVLIRDNGLCKHCLKDNKVSTADMVHHIIEVKQNWNRRLDLDNLISLCNSCHNKIHKDTPH